MIRSYEKLIKMAIFLLSHTIITYAEKRMRLVLIFQQIKFGKPRLLAFLFCLRGLPGENINYRQAENQRTDVVNSCYCCLKAEETCNYLLLWCLTTYSLWCMVYGLLGIDWVIVGSVQGEIWA